jgi:hypothetical protein
MPFPAPRIACGTLEITCGVFFTLPPLMCISWHILQRETASPSVSLHGAFATSVDVTYAPKASTLTYFGGADRSAM